ncbi:MAG TPA: PEGA domain-containing protein [Polyangiaceae bacterium]|nr:PEGA domain-containing protein [Polyangiaceae bacterium]
MTRLGKLRRLLLALALIWLQVPGLARADDKQQARAAFQAGVKAFQQGDFAGALSKFQQADAAAHSPAITYNVARTLEKLNRAQAAVDAYEAYVAEAGEGGEFTSSAVVAIAQLKARSTQLSIESTPAGAEITLDGEKLKRKTPVTTLVARGPHQIALELGDWKEARGYEAPGGGSMGQLVFVRTQAPQPPATPAPAKAEPKPVLPPAPPRIQGLMGSANLSFSAYRFFGTADESSGMTQTTADTTAGGVVFGLAFDAGYAFNSRLGVLLRLFGGLGSSEEALATLGAGGPVVAYRLTESWWLGGGVAVGAGRADADATAKDRSDSNAILDSQITFETNFAIGPTLELGYVIDQNQNGHWLIELMPTLLITTSSRESTLFVPLTLGYRWF